MLNTGTFFFHYNLHLRFKMTVCKNYFLPIDPYTNSYQKVCGLESPGKLHNQFESCERDDGLVTDDFHR